MNYLLPQTHGIVALCELHIAADVEPGALGRIVGERLVKLQLDVECGVSPDLDGGVGEDGTVEGEFGHAVHEVEAGQGETFANNL